MEGAFRSGAVLVGKYRIDTLLGRDGMCLVFAGTHLQMSLPVVLKILVPESVTSLAVHARFLREAQSIARLTGEHIARTIDVGILPEGVPYCAMEALHGIDLGSELARRGALMPGEAVDYILQGCEALAEAHAHGIVHGELKPAHLFFAARPDGTMAVKVLGFELSRSVQTQPGARPATSGTPGYQAPEQVKPTEEIDGRADVWALGIVLYQCITGRHPFQADSVSLMQHAAANDSPRPMDPGIPRPLQAVVLRCLEKHRDARFPSIADLAAALAPFAHDQRTAAAIVDRASFMSHGLGGGYEIAPHGQYPIIAPPTVPAGYAPSPTRRRYATIGLGVLAVSLSGIAAAALIVPGRTGSSDKTPAAQASLTPSNVAAPKAAAPPAAPVATASAPSSALGDSAADNPPATPPSAAGSNPPGAPTPAADTASPPTGVNAADRSSTPNASSTATDSPARAKASPSSDDAPAIASARQPSSERDDRAAERAAKSAATSKQTSAERGTERTANDRTERAANVRAANDRTTNDRTANDRTANDRTANDRTAIDRTANDRTANDRTGAERTANDRTANDRTQNDRTANERTGAERTAAAAAPRGKRGESCDSMDVDELMTRAAIQYDAGSATSALSFTRVALGCKQTDRMYWLAVMYACAAHDVANARLYFPKVPSGLQSGLETKCQRENLDVRSRKVD